MFGGHLPFGHNRLDRGGFLYFEFERGRPIVATVEFDERQIDESNPITALFQIGTWLPFQGNMLLFPLMALVSVAIIIFFLPETRRVELT